jgi:hypothetical protein
MSAPVDRQRRGLLAGAAAALGAGMVATIPIGAEAAPSPEEAEFTRLCNRVVELRTQISALYPRIRDDKERRVAEAPLRDERRATEARLYELNVTPKTQAGIKAVALAGLAEAPRDFDGEVDASGGGLSEWLAWTVVEAIAPREAQAYVVALAAESEGWRS